jgi:hypothetical protein
VAVAAFAFPGVANAAPTSFSITADYSAFQPGLMTFTTVGLCPSGSFQSNWTFDDLGSQRAPVIDVFSGHVNSTAWEHIPVARASGVDTYVCDDGSGTFVVDWNGVGRFFEGPPDGLTGTFHITSGTGVFAGIQAVGSFSFIIFPGGGPHFTFSGTRLA